MKNLIKENWFKLSIWAGLIGPTFFVIVFTLEGWFRPGYNPIGMYVSALSLGSRGFIQMANFIIFGLLLLMFTHSVAVEFQNGKKSRAGVILLRITAIYYLLSGPFVMDPTGTPLNQISLHGTLHGIFGAIVFLLMPISCFVFLRCFRDNPKWQSFQWWTLIMGTIIAVAVIFLTIATKIPATSNIFIEWLGLIQRIAIMPYMLWLFTFALEMYNKNRINRIG